MGREASCRWNRGCYQGDRHDGDFHLEEDQSPQHHPLHRHDRGSSSFSFSHSSSGKSRLDLTFPLIPTLLIKTSMFPKMSQACLTNFWMVAASEETSSSRGAASLVFVGEKVLLISEQRDWRRSRRQACDDLAAGFG